MRSRFFARWRRWLLLVILPGAVHAAEWREVTPAELAATEPELEPDAPAEVLFWEREIDDRRFPLERRFSDYVRYKIYAPDQAENLTRLSRLTASDQPAHHLKLRARLTLPNGTSREFGEDDIRERSSVQSADRPNWIERLFVPGTPSVKERFLAVTGVERGAVLEFQIEWRDESPGWSLGVVMQRVQLPIRELSLVVHTPREDDFAQRIFLLNGGICESDFATDEKKRVATLTARGVPSGRQERFAGAPPDYALTVLIDYMASRVRIVGRGRSANIRIDPKTDGPWAITAGLNHLYQQGATQPTKKVREHAHRLVAGATSDAERARLIHDHVRELHQRFTRAPALPPGKGREPRNLTEILEFEEKNHLRLNDQDFLWLALALYREAGLKADYALLPSRRFARFSQRLVSPAMLPDSAAAVTIDGQIHFSNPRARVPLAFGELEWENQGFGALIAKDGPQEFVPTPPLPAEASGQITSGKLLLESGGDLFGRCQQRLTGHFAIEQRRRLSGKSPEERQEFLRESLAEEFKNGDISDIELTGADEPGDLVVAFDVRLPGHAVDTGEQIILKPAVLRAGATTLFPESERRHHVQFPFPWHEVDQFTITVPDGFAPPASTEPRVVHAGENFLHRSSVTRIDERSFRYRRDTIVRGIIVPVESYAGLKAWADEVALDDQRELLLEGTSATATAGL